jgi:hypothetical protein
MVRAPSRHMEPDRLPLLILQLVTAVLRVTSRKLRQSPNKFHINGKESHQGEKEEEKTCCLPCVVRLLGTCCALAPGKPRGAGSARGRSPSRSRSSCAHGTRRHLRTVTLGPSASPLCRPTTRACSSSSSPSTASTSSFCGRRSLPHGRCRDGNGSGSGRVEQLPAYQ